MSYWLPRVCAEPEVPSEALVWVHETLCAIPRPISELLGSCGVAVRASFPWEDIECRDGRPWHDVGGYWNSDTLWASVNAEWCDTRDKMAAVVLHELGHGLSIDVLPKPHRWPDFRTAWSTGRRRVKERWPDDYAGYERLGVFCGHWTQAVQEVWAEAFAWIFGARCLTHPAFGEVFAECIALVQGDLDALEAAP